MSDTSSGLFQFPCEWPVKVLGPNSPSFRAEVLAVFVTELGSDSVRMSERASRAGTYVALTMTFEAIDVAQIERLNRGLQAVAGVRLVL